MKSFLRLTILAKPSKRKRELKIAKRSSLMVSMGGLNNVCVYIEAARQRPFPKGRQPTAELSQPRILWGAKETCACVTGGIVSARG